MTMKDAIIRADRENNGRMLTRIMDALRFGTAFHTKDGTPVLFNYQETKDLFVRYGVDPNEFETLCNLADSEGE